MNIRTINEVKNIYRNIKNVEYEKINHSLDNYLKKLKRYDLAFCQFHLDEQIIDLVNKEDYFPSNEEIIYVVDNDIYGLLINYLIQMIPYAKEQVKKYIDYSDEKVKVFGQAVLVYKDLWDLLEVNSDEILDILVVSFSSKRLNNSILEKIDCVKLINRFVEKQNDININSYFLNNLTNLSKVINLTKDTQEKIENLITFVFTSQSYVYKDFDDLLYNYLLIIPNLFEVLFKNLRIDPYTKQTDYGKWLIDARKFCCLIKISEQLNYDPENSEFLNKSNLFREFYANDLEYVRFLNVG